MFYLLDRSGVPAVSRQSSLIYSRMWLNGIIPDRIRAGRWSLKTYLDYLFWDSRLVELRHQVGGRWITGWFDNVDDLRSAAAPRLDTGNLFTNLHCPVDRVVSNAMSGSPLVNDDVERDPDTASTDAQLALAKVKAEELAKVLRLMGWPEPLLAMSGNGYHLQYRIALPNDAETEQRLRVLYRGLAGEFSDHLVRFDPTVRNPARICALYRTRKRKGPDARRHRQSQVWIPRDWRQVRPRHYEASRGNTFRASSDVE